MNESRKWSKKKTFLTLGVCLLAIGLIIGSLFTVTIVTEWLTTSNLPFNQNAQIASISVQTSYTYPNGTTIMLEHHDANKTNNGLDWLVNRTTGFGNNASQTMIYIGWSNSSQNCGLTTTHLPYDFNDSANQGNGFGRKTLTSSNWTRWTTYGKFNLTAKAYASEIINGVKKVYLAFKSTTVYNCYIAIDVITPTLNFPSGGIIQSTFIITIS